MDHGTASLGGALVAVVAVLVTTTGLWLWSLIHCIQNKRISDSNRTLGIILIVILGLLGSLIYMFMPESSGRRYGSRNLRTVRGRGQPQQRGTRSFGATRPVARTRR